MPFIPVISVSNCSFCLFLYLVILSDEEDIKTTPEDIKATAEEIRRIRFGRNRFGLIAVNKHNKETGIHRISLRLFNQNNSKESIQQDNLSPSDSEDSLYNNNNNSDSEMSDCSNSSSASQSFKLTWSNVNKLLSNCDTWIMHLKDSYLTDDVSYRNNKLVILWGFPLEFLSLTIQEVYKINKSLFALTRKSSVTFLPRCNHGQFYIAQGLRKAPHFTLTSKAVNKAKKILSLWSIPFGNNNVPQSPDTDNHHLFFTSIDNTQVFKKLIASKVKEMMSAVANSGLIDWFASSKSNLQRARYTLSLGITSNKCHCYKRTTITGQVALDLLSLPSLSHNCIQSIGKLLMFLSHDQFTSILPTEFQSVFSINRNKHSMEYLHKFAEQLLIPSSEFTNKFMFPACSFLVNNDVYPHCDSLNPTSLDQDYTFVLTTMIETSSIQNEVTRKIFEHEYPTSIPLCLVLYNRNRLIKYSERMMLCDNRGIDSIVELIRSANTDRDYSGNFFVRDRSNLEFRVDTSKLCTFKHPKLILGEAVDKMVSSRYHLLMSRWYIGISHHSLSMIGILVINTSYVFAVCLAVWMFN